MARTRKIIDAKDLNTGELAFFNSHAKVTYMSDGSNVEDKINSLNFVNPDELSNVATSGSYNDLTDKPIIPDENTITDWGFTKDATSPSRIEGIISLKNANNVKSILTLDNTLNKIRYFLIGDTNGKLPSNQKCYDIPADVVKTLNITTTNSLLNTALNSLVSVDKFNPIGVNVGDLIAVTLLEVFVSDLANALGISIPGFSGTINIYQYKLLSTNDAKAPNSESSQGVMGLMSPNDKTQLNNVSNKLNTVLPFITHSGNNFNMNNCLESGIYPHCTTGRPPGSANGTYYTCITQKSTNADNNGYYTYKQTCYGRSGGDLGKIYERIFFLGGNGGDNWGEGWKRIDTTDCATTDYVIKKVDDLGGAIENYLEDIFTNIYTPEVSYSDLIEIKNNNGLLPGKQYRITDYVTTTTQENTISTGHQFDIIVTADSPNTINENAKAILHEGDEYFTNCNLNAWELKYCLDNDTNKFAWADLENGKGVIYYMKDEYNNECSYDFKNIQYLNEEQYFYTFSNLFDGILDDSINPYNDINYCYNNKIAPCRYEGILTLNNIYFKNIYPLAKCRNNNIGVDCKNITFGSACSDNVFTLNCKDIILNDECGDNVFKNDCANITLGKDSNRNIFDCDNEYITFGKKCNNNILSQRCSDITFDDECCDNNMYQYCCVITLGKSCNTNTFYQNCNTNTLGSYCNNNIFYQNVNCCDLGDFNESIVFGSSCSSCVINTDSSNDVLRSYCNNISFNSGCNNIKIYHSLPTYSTSEKTLKNIKVIGSLKNEVISLNDRVNLENNEYITNIAKNSGGILKIYCEADLINI